MAPRHVWTSAELAVRGLSRRAIARSVTRGELTRLRRGIYASHLLAPEVARAARLGGAVSCVSALAIHGVWTVPSPLHIRIPADAPMPSVAGIVVHRRGASPGATVIDPPFLALEHAVRCVDDLMCVVLIDSAIHRGVIHHAEITALLATTKRGRRLLARVDASAESGTETMVRVRLRRHRIRLRTQVVIADIGRVDLLVGDRLVIEVDGEEWHDRESTFESDRARDAALTVRGYVVLRYSYRRVMFDWDAAEAEILSLIRRGRHVRPSGGIGR